MTYRRSPASPRRDPRSAAGRGGIWLACVATSVGVHVALLWVTGAAMTPPATQPLRSHASSVPPVVVVLASEDRESRPGPDRAASIVRGPTARQAAASAAAGKETGAPETHYYTTPEVDHPSDPVEDWHLDVADLDAIGAQHLVFDVAVDAAGRIVECRIVEPASLAEAARRRLEAKLAGTPMSPAIRAAKDVPSRRRIEIFAMPVTTQALPAPAASSP